MMSSTQTRCAGISALTLSLWPTFAAADMTLESTDLIDGSQLPIEHVLNGFGCEGGNESPALSWSGYPDDTASFLITAYDPDAPTGSGFWHWSVFNIPREVTTLPRGAILEGLVGKATQARNDFSQNAYSGACPPSGSQHRYIFTVYAMPQEELPLDETASSALVGFFANTSALDSASITVEYSR